MTDYTGALKDVSALELGAIAARAAFAKTGVKPEWIDHVSFGNVLQTSSDAIYGARHVALKAGVPIEVPALTVNRLCGSGIQAAVSGAQLIQLGEADIVLTGGIESMSQAPHVMRGLRSGLRLGQGKLEDYAVRSAARSVLRLLHGADGREVRGQVRHLARGAGRVRAAQPAAGGEGVERGALRGRGRAGRDQDRARASTVVDKDDHLRPDTTLEGLAKLPAAFSKDGTVTAGNASGIVDGGAALILASDAGREGTALKPLGAAGRVGRRSASTRRSWAWARRPRRARCSQRAGLTLDDIDLIEVNEAFAGAVPRRREGARPRSREGQRQRRRDRARPPARHDGHAAAADAARSSCGRRGKKYGLATACIGGGQGIAAIVETELVD